MTPINDASFALSREVKQPYSITRENCLEKFASLNVVPPRELITLSFGCAPLIKCQLSETHLSHALWKRWYLWIIAFTHTHTNMHTSNERARDTRDISENNQPNLRRSHFRPYAFMHKCFGRP